VRDPYFPFHALGFRSNPFRALSDDEWADVVVLPEAVSQAAALGGHLQVLGRLGRGKTSTLLGLAAQLRRAGQRAAYEYLAVGCDVFTTAPAGLDVFLLDEAQRLRHRERGRLLAAAGAGPRLILGSHEDLAPQFENSRLPLATVRLGAPDATHLAAILARRLDYFALEPGQPAVTFDASATDLLQARFGGNLRAIEHFLYEVFQALEAPLVLTEQNLKVPQGEIGE